MRDRSEETNRAAGHKLRRSAGGALAILVFLSLTVSPARSSCERLVLTFANVPGQRTVHVRPHAAVSIVGEYWTNDCFDTGGGGACSGPGNERPIKNIVVEVIREDKTDKVLVAEGISAEGEDESWSLTFRVPDLPPGNYFIQAKEKGSSGGGGMRLFLRVSPDAPTWP